MIDLHKVDTKTETVKIKDIDTARPFREGLEYSAPARGTWTIAHTSMLIPECHQIFVCPPGCLRGVVLSAAEYGGLDRFSMISVKENDLYDDNMENLFIEGVTDIINKLTHTPPCVLIYTSCVQHFINCDENMVYAELRRRFPDIDFIDCYMMPTMRKSITPDELMTRQLYAALPDVPKDDHSVNVIGGYYVLDPECEIRQMLNEAGYRVRDICEAKTYSEYKDMAKSALNIYNAPVANAAVRELKHRIGQDNIFMPFCWDFEEIEASLKALSERTGASLPDINALRERADKALWNLKKEIGDTPVEIDYTATPRPLGLGALLISYGINVTRIHSDVILPGEDKALEYLKRKKPELPLTATINFRCRIKPRNAAEKYGGRLIAIGQKAAYATGTEHFVNMIVNNGFYGFTGIIKTAEIIKKAYEQESDVRSIISVKGWGCSC